VVRVIHFQCKVITENKLHSIGCKYASFLSARWGLFSFDVNSTNTSVQSPASDVDLRSPSDPEFAAWRTSGTAAGVLATSPSASSFADILQDELQQRETLHHTTNKPLALIQVSNADKGEKH